MSCERSLFYALRYHSTVCMALASSLLAGAQVHAGITGLWEFDNAANIGRATIGTDLAIVGTAPTHFASQTYGGRTLQGVIETSPGVGNHLIASHGIAPNGGGTRVNQYSLLFDLRRPATDLWRTIFQSDPANANDGDFFIRNSDQQLGVGTLGYTTNYQMPADQWTRVVITADLAAAGAFRTYIDGTLVQSHNPTAVDNDRFSFLPTLLLFGDEDNENQLLSVGTVAMWDQSLTDAQVAILGVAGTAVPEPGSLAALSVVMLVGCSYRRRTMQRFSRQA